MKKLTIILIIFALIFCLVGCGYSSVERVDERQKPTSMFVLVERSLSWQIVYHKETKVMYVISDSQYNCGTFTLLVDADGKPLLYGGD